MSPSPSAGTRWNEISLIPNGFNAYDLERTSQEEIDAFRNNYVRGGRSGYFWGYPLYALDFWLENRPDVLKSYRQQAYQAMSGLHSYPHFLCLAMLHQYVIIRFEDGVLHEIDACEARGISKQQILEVLAVSFLHSGPSGMRFVSSGSGEYLRKYHEPTTPAEFPAGWLPDPGAFRSGLDFSSATLTSDEGEKLRAWYIATIGEVPQSVTFLAEHHPGLLKAYRARWETAIRDGLPKQMMPYLMLQYNVSRGFGAGIRENVLLGKAWGMTKEQLIDAVGSGMSFHGGLDSISVVVDALAGVL
jgi:hypothetical protein